MDRGPVAGGLLAGGVVAVLATGLFDGLVVGASGVT